MSADARTVEALSVAMALAPGVYARNRMFSFYERYDGQRARSRANMLRAIVRQLGAARRVTVAADDVAAHVGEARFVLSYAIPSIGLSRVVGLSRVELATLRVLAARAGASALVPADDDMALVEAALHTLLGLGAATDAGTAQAATATEAVRAALTSNVASAEP